MCWWWRESGRVIVLWGGKFLIEEIDDEDEFIDNLLGKRMSKHGIILGSFDLDLLDVGHFLFVFRFKEGYFLLNDFVYFMDELKDDDDFLLYFDILIIDFIFLFHKHLIDSRLLRWSIIFHRKMIVWNAIYLFIEES
jgi:hypothetical protein